MRGYSSILTLVYGELDDLADFATERVLDTLSIIVVFVLLATIDCVVFGRVFGIAILVVMAITFYTANGQAFFLQERETVALWLCF